MSGLFWACLVLAPLSVCQAETDTSAQPETHLTDLSVEELMNVEVATVYGASKFEQKVNEAPSSVSIVTADEILVLDHGTIVERGTHRELLAHDGLYASMWNRQREAQIAREILAGVEEAPAAPNRNPPAVPEAQEHEPELVPAADAAE